MLSRYETLLRLPCKTWKSVLQLKEKHHRYLYCRHRTLLYPSRFSHKSGHPRCAIKIDFLLTKGLVSNYEYSNGDGNVSNSIEPVSDLMTVLWIARRCSLSRLLTFLTDICPPKRALIAHRNIRLSSLRLVLWGLPDRGRSSTIPVASKLCIRRSITKWCTTICPDILLLLTSVSKTVAATA